MCMRVRSGAEPPDAGLQNRQHVDARQTLQNARRSSGRKLRCVGTPDAIPLGRPLLIEADDNR